ncbi:MAG: GNAT family N-acetyltransferase, partial [Nocardioidaceae bacterium]
RHPSFSTVAARSPWTRTDRYVASEARGAGAARALILEAEALAAEAGAITITLETTPDNLNAQRLYERLGYDLSEGYLHYTKTLG